jgi:hypothetical protein
VKREFLKKVIVSGMTMLIITSMYTVSASAKWIEDSGDNWSWMEDGTKAVGWKAINSNWYYFDSYGVMNTGWELIDGNWYYLNNDGAMYTGWKLIDGKWYHLNENGQMSIGWINDKGIEYYTNSSGEMQIGTVTVNGNIYTFSDSGAMLNGNSISQEKKADLGDVAKGNNSSRSSIGYVSTNSDSLNVRSDATISSDIIGKVAKGAEVKIVDDEKNGFYPIILSGKKGWVSSQWISFDGADNTSTQTIINPPAINSDSSINTVTSLINNENSKQKVDSMKLGVIRNTEPSLDNKYYYSDENLFYKVKLSPPFFSGGKEIKGNCTWYAWGRAWEITGSKPTDAGFMGNAYEWWDANRKSGKYQYGSEPRVGAIGVWKSSLPGSEGSGHVAIVEKIDNGKVYISESTWHGLTFNYKEIYDTDYMYGYIYLDKPNY